MKEIFKTFAVFVAFLLGIAILVSPFVYLIRQGNKASEERAFAEANCLRRTVVSIEPIAVSGGIFGGDVQLYAHYDDGTVRRSYGYAVGDSECKN